MTDTRRQLACDNCHRAITFQELNGRWVHIDDPERSILDSCGAQTTAAFSREPTTETKHFSFSQLDQYARCGEQYRLQRIVGVEQIENLAGVGGSAMHLVFELFPSPDSALDDLVECFNNVFTQKLAEIAEQGRAVSWGGNKSAKWPDGENERWWRENGAPMMLERYLKIRALDKERDLIDIELGDEMRVTAMIGEDEVVGYIDKILMLDKRDGKLVRIVRDYKTGSTFSLKLEQLVNYAWLANYAKGWDVTIGQFVWLRGAKSETMLIEHDLTKFVSLVPRLYDDLARGLAANIFPMRPSLLCKSCGVRLYCEWGKNLPEEESDDE